MHIVLKGMTRVVVSRAGITVTPCSSRMGNVRISQLPLVRSPSIFDEEPMPHSAETKAGTTYGVKERRDLGSFHEPRSSIVALTHFGVSGIRSTNR